MYELLNLCRALVERHPEWMDGLPRWLRDAYTGIYYEPERVLVGTKTHVQLEKKQCTITVSFPLLPNPCIDNVFQVLASDADNYPMDAFHEMPRSFEPTSAIIPDIARLYPLIYASAVLFGYGIMYNLHFSEDHLEPFLLEWRDLIESIRNRQGKQTEIALAHSNIDTESIAFWLVYKAFWSVPYTLFKKAMSNTIQKTDEGFIL